MTILRALFLIVVSFAQAQTVRVMDSRTGAPIPRAVVTVAGIVTEADTNGFAIIDGKPSESVLVRAVGYKRAEVLIRIAEEQLEVRLVPFAPKALYLTGLGLATSSLREPALNLLDQTELNSLVIDVKGDPGWIGYSTSVPLAAEIGALRAGLSRNTAQIEHLRSMGIYLIARIVVFKDSPLALSRPELAVKTRSGAIWRDREDLAWTDPFQRPVWDYNIDIAVEAASRGFDEVQFDYVRFPDAGGLVFSKPNTRENRIQAVQGFLREARNRLAPYNVFLAGDVFGYVVWNAGDTEVGQQLETLVQDLDYVCPMLYPSGFQYGIRGYRTAVAYPYEIVRLSLENAWTRTRVDRQRFRPWLQAFRDYAFDRRAFGPEQIKAQIRAAEDFGSNGWMVWNPRNTYPGDAFLPE